MDAFFEDFAEFFEEFFICFGFAFVHFFEFAQNFAGYSLLDTADDGVILQNFAGNIEREVAGIDYTFYKSQVIGDKFFAFIGNKDAFDIELQAFFWKSGIKRLKGITSGMKSNALNSEVPSADI